MVISRGSGTEFDPDIVDVFESIPDKLAEIETSMITVH
jgi:HD-GYP domain-containing protein (c-di-GMP phosphodiesterase class II)